MKILINEHAKLLLLNYSNETINTEYLNFIFKMPLIGFRPPYYINPRYDLNYPII